MNDKVQDELRSAFLNPFGEIAVPDLNNLPSVDIVWQRKSQTWPIPTIDPSIQLREMVIAISGSYYLWKTAWWNKTSTSRGMVLHDTITAIPALFAQSLLAAEPGSTNEMSSEDRGELERIWFSGLLNGLREEIFSQSFALAKDIIHDLGEISSCLTMNCHRACLALVGRCLEVVLKVGLDLRGNAYQQDWMVGRLLTEYADKGIYLDPTLKNSFNILNVHRVNSVHCKESSEVPSREQTLAVVMMLIDTVKRCLFPPRGA